MDDSYFFLHAFLASTDVSKSQDLLNSTMGGHGPIGGWKQSRAGIEGIYQIQNNENAHVKVGLTVEEPKQLLLTVDADVWMLMASATWADAMFHISSLVGAVVSRTTLSGFGSGVLPSELSGELTSLHWFQYLSPAIASRWPAEVLMTGPFTRAMRDTGGGVAIVLGDSPFNPSGRRAAAAYLSIQLRPLYGRNPATGDPMVVPYE